jgi:hypothetical protein
VCVFVFVCVCVCVCAFVCVCVCVCVCQRLHNAELTALCCCYYPINQKKVSPRYVKARLHNMFMCILLLIVYIHTYMYI